ncbi:uncharacterized protein ACIQIH_006509 [Cyanocitta cristata]
MLPAPKLWPSPPPCCPRQPAHHSQPAAPTCCSTSPQRPALSPQRRSTSPQPACSCHSLTPESRCCCCCCCCYLEVTPGCSQEPHSDPARGRCDRPWGPAAVPGARPWPRQPVLRRWKGHAACGSWEIAPSPPWEPHRLTVARSMHTPSAELTPAERLGFLRALC